MMTPQLGQGTKLPEETSNPGIALFHGMTQFMLVC